MAETERPRSQREKKRKEREVPGNRTKEEKYSYKTGRKKGKAVSERAKS